MDGEVVENQGPTVSLSWTEPPSPESLSLTDETGSNEITPDYQDTKAVHREFKPSATPPSYFTNISENSSIQKESIPSSENLPRSYFENNMKETILINYFCRKFKHQCIRRFPLRKPPLLVLPNDLGIPKMLCTSIHMSKIPLPDFNTCQNIAQFLSQHITILQTLNQPPTILRAPNTVLASQKANCLEMSNLLVSLLNGININAYVVWGYATHQVCANDQTARPCPVTIDVPEMDKRVSIKNIHLDKETINNRYLIDLHDSKYKYDPDKNRNYESRTDKKNRLKQQNEVLEKENIERRKKIQKELLKKKRPSPVQPFGLHSWVLIFEDLISDSKNHSSTRPQLPYMRATSQKKITVTSSNKPIEEKSKNKLPCFPYFIEPSTGMRHEVDDENYIGIEAVYNHNNYWFNRQSSQIGFSDHRSDRQGERFSELTFNFNNKSAWKSLLKAKWPHITFDTYTKKRIRRLRKEKDVDNRKDISLIRPRPFVIFKMPYTWTESVTMKACKYLGETYGEKQDKRMKYHKTILEQFEELSHPEGIVKRLSYYLDVQYKFLNKLIEEYKNRIDKIRYRQVNYSEQILEEYFYKGRRDALKAYHFKHTKQEYEVRLEFSANDRADGMKTFYVHGSYDRIDIKFENRKDFIKEIYGEAFQAQERTKDESNVITKKNHSNDQKDITSITQFVSGSKEKCTLATNPATHTDNSIVFAYVVFNRNSIIPCDEDIEKMTFFPTLDQIEVEYHSDPLDIVPLRKVITKTQSFDQSEAEVLKIYPKNSYVLPSLHSSHCIENIKRFKDLKDNVFTILNQSKDLMEKIINDRTEERKNNEMIPRKMHVEPNPVHKVEEKVKNLKREFREKLISLYH